MNRSITLQIELDSDDVDNAYLAAHDLAQAIEKFPVVVEVKVLSGVADE